MYKCEIYILLVLTEKQNMYICTCTRISIDVHASGCNSRKVLIVILLIFAETILVLPEII